MMDKLEIPMPESGMATTVEEALAIAKENRLSGYGSSFLRSRWSWNGSCIR